MVSISGRYSYKKAQQCHGHHRKSLRYPTFKNFVCLVLVKPWSIYTFDLSNYPFKSNKWSWQKNCSSPRRCLWHSGVKLCGVLDTAEFDSAGSEWFDFKIWISTKYVQYSKLSWWQWLCDINDNADWAWLSGISDTAEFFWHLKISQRNRNHTRIYCTIWIRGQHG